MTTTWINFINLFTVTICQWTCNSLSCMTHDIIITFVWTSSITLHWTKIHVIQFKEKLNLNASLNAIGNLNFRVLDWTIYVYTFCCYEALAYCFSEHFKYIIAMKTFFLISEIKPWYYLVFMEITVKNWTKNRTFSLTLWLNWTS